MPVYNEQDAIVSVLEKWSAALKARDPKKMLEQAK